MDEPEAIITTEWGVAVVDMRSLDFSRQGWLGYTSRKRKKNRRTYIPAHEVKHLQFPCSEELLGDTNK